jgi:PKD repeat protein
MKRKKLVITLLCALIWSSLSAQKINRAEYFFDTDPGIGNGTQLSFTASDNVEITKDITIPESLKGGIHVLFARVQNDQGVWSMPESYLLSVQNGFTKLISAEYFFDTDPGLGKGTKISFTPSDNINITQAISIPDSLKGGLHVLFARVKNTSGTWSLSEAYLISVQNGFTALTAAEYFFDTDPGIGSATPIVFPASADSINLIQYISIPALSLGNHTLYVRTKNQGRTWSFPEAHTIGICTSYGPVSSFSHFVDGNEIFFTDSSANSESRKWLFGDNTSDTTFNPRHVYASGNNYTVKLITKNGCGSDTLSKTIGIFGVQSISATTAPQNGTYIGYIKGVGFLPGTTVRLSNAAAMYVPADTTVVESSSLLKVIFMNSNETVGLYDVIVHLPSGTEYILPNGLVIAPETEYNIWSRLDGRKEVIYNRWSKFSLVIGNNGNQTAWGVPVVIRMPGRVQAKLMNRTNNSTLPQEVISATMDHFYLAKDSIANDSATLCYLMLPYLEAGQTRTIEFEIKAPPSKRFAISTLAGNPYYDETTLLIKSSGALKASEESNTSNAFKQPTSFCDPPKCIKCLIDILGFFPGPGGCATGVYSYGCTLYGLGSGGGSPMGNVFDVLAGAVGTFVNCGGAAAKVGGYIEAAAAGFDGASSGFGAVKDCLDCLPPLKPDSILPRYSFDPNVKEGPSGYGDHNYTRWQDPLVYSIHFENQVSASAPASEVVVTDYLDASKLDLSTLKFLGFGFSDTTVRYSIADTMVIQDIDLRPSKNSIVRVSSMIDSVNKLSFHFTTYDPATMKLTNSIDDGFLNPNVNGTEGMGYVSYQVNAKPGLPTGTIINNTAKIVFDYNAPILTNIWTNGIDKEKPASKVLEEVVKINDSTFKINWEGSDTHAGVFFYRIMLSEDGGPFSEWIATDTTSGNFVAKESVTYRFYSIAEDFVGNIEDAPASADLVLVNTVGVKQLDNTKNITLYPNPTTGKVAVNGILKGDEIRISATDGKSISKQVAGSSSQTFDLSQQSPGIYFLTVVSQSGKIQTLKVIKK